MESNSPLTIEKRARIFNLEDFKSPQSQIVQILHSPETQKCVESLTIPYFQASNDLQLPFPQEQRKVDYLDVQSSSKTGSSPSNHTDSRARASDR